MSAQSEAAPAATSGATAAKADPTLSITSPASLIVSEQTTIQAILADSNAATGTITFSVYGSDDPTCSSAPLATLPSFPVDGDGTYDQLILPPETGNFPLVARYSGDENNEAAANGCGDPGSVVNVIDPDEDVCPVPRPRLSLETFPRPRPFGESAQVMGIRTRLRATSRVIAWVTPSISYRVSGQKKTVNLKARVFRLDPAKKARFRVPGALVRDFRRAGKRMRGARVTFKVKARLREIGSSPRCIGPRLPSRVSARLSAVSRRVALRRLGSA